jgi:hypothetical protein
MKHSELGFRLIKIADIGYITILYAIAALVTAKAFDIVSKKIDTQRDEEKSSVQLFVEIIVYLWVAGIAVYGVRNLMELVPSPFEGVFGLEHLRVKELGNAGVFVFIFFYFEESLKKKLTVLYNRLLI